MDGRNAPAIATGTVLFLAGLTAGALAYAWLGPLPKADPQVQGAIVAGLAAITAALLAIVGGWWGATKSASAVLEATRLANEANRLEAEAARAEQRRATVRERRGKLVGKIATLSYRHAQEVSQQLDRWVELVGQPDDTSMPAVSPTTPIQDAVFGLYAIGSQSLADLGASLLQVLYWLDGLVYVASADKRGGAISAPGNRLLERNVLSTMLALINTELMVEGSREFSFTPWKPGGTLPKNYLDRKRREAELELRRITGEIATASGGVVVDGPST
ncbi:MAG TPA: hypothetical protein VF960_03260 [Chloroflexota bacterium]